MIGFRVLRLPILLSYLPGPVVGYSILTANVFSVLVYFEPLLGLNTAREAAVRMEQNPKRVGRSVALAYREIVGLLLFGLVAASPLILSNDLDSRDVAYVLWFGGLVASGWYLYSSRLGALMDGYRVLWVSRTGKLIYEVTGFTALVLCLWVFRLGAYAIVLSLLIQVAIYAWFLELQWRRQCRPWTGLADPQRLNEPDSSEERQLARTLVWDGVWAASIHLGTLVVYVLPTIVVASTLGVAAVTDYNIACQLYQLVNFASVPLLMAYYPRLASAPERSEYGHVLAYSWMLSLIVGVTVLLVGEYIVRTWVGVGHFLGLPTYALLALVTALDVVQVGQRMLLISAGRTKSAAALAILAAVSTIAAMSALAPKFGLTGILAGIVVIEALVLNVGAFWIAFYALPESRAKFVHAWRKTVIPSGVFLLVLCRCLGFLGPGQPEILERLLWIAATATAVILSVEPSHRVFGIRQFEAILARAKHKFRRVDG